MGLRQARLQTKRLHCCGFRFFLSRGRRIEVVIYPVLNPSQSGKRTGELGIKFRCFLKKLLGLFCITPEFVHAREQIVSLEKREVGFAVFRRFALDLRFFRG